MTPRSRVVAAGLVAVSLLTACAHHVVGGRVTTRTVVVTPTPPTPSTSAAPSTPKPTPKPKPSSKPPEPVVKRLPGTCKSLLDADSVNAVMGQKLGGSVQYGHGGGEADINRLGYIDCKYGMVHGKAPAVEIRVGLYRTARDAANRIAATVQDFELHGALASTTKIGGYPATMLLGANMLAYGPTLLKVSSQRTIAITLRPGWDKPEKVLPKLGGLALKRTG